MINGKKQRMYTIDFSDISYTGNSLIMNWVNPAEPLWLINGSVGLLELYARWATLWCVACTFAYENLQCKCAINVPICALPTPLAKEIYYVQ